MLISKSEKVHENFICRFDIWNRKSREDDFHLSIGEKIAVKLHVLRF